MDEDGIVGRIEDGLEPGDARTIGGLAPAQGLGPLPDLAPLVESVALDGERCAFITGENMVVMNWRSGEVVATRPIRTQAGTGVVGFTGDRVYGIVSVVGIYDGRTLELIGYKRFTKDRLVNACSAKESDMKVLETWLRDTSERCWCAAWTANDHGPMHYDAVTFRRFIVDRDVYVVRDATECTYIGNTREEIRYSFLASGPGPDASIVAAEDGWLKQLSVADIRPLPRALTFAEAEARRGPSAAPGAKRQQTSSGVPVDVIDV